jgi:hypothetical protein
MHYFKCSTSIDSTNGTKGKPDNQHILRKTSTAQQKMVKARELVFCRKTQMADKHIHNVPPNLQTR